VKGIYEDFPTLTLVASHLAAASAEIIAGWITL